MARSWVDGLIPAFPGASRPPGRPWPSPWEISREGAAAHVARLRGNVLGWPAALLAVLIAAALVGPYLTPYDPARVDLRQTLLPPGLDHPLGTDALGRDLLSRSFHGARVSLAVGLISPFLAVAGGMAVGLLAACRGGVIDAVATHLVEGFISVPALLLVVAVQAVIGPGTANVILLAALLGWVPAARVVRSLCLTLNEREFVVAARSIGCSDLRIVFRHLLPNLAPQGIALFTLSIADALLLEAGLGFLGLGVPPTMASWGNMLSDAPAALVAAAWWVAAFPGLLILITSLAANLAGDRLQETLA